MFSTIATALIYLFLPFSLPDPRQPVCHCFPGSPLGLYSYFPHIFYIIIFYFTIFIHYVTWLPLPGLRPPYRASSPCYGVPFLLWGGTHLILVYTINFHFHSFNLVLFPQLSLFIVFYIFILCLNTI